MTGKHVTTEELKVGDIVTDAPDGVRVTSIEEEPGPLRITWSDGESEIYDREQQWELAGEETDQ